MALLDSLRCENQRLLRNLPDYRQILAAQHLECADLRREFAKHGNDSVLRTFRLAVDGCWREPARLEEKAEWFWHGSRRETDRRLLRGVAKEDVN